MKLNVIVRLAASLVAVLCLALAPAGSTAEDLPYAVGQPFPEFWGKTLEGNVARLSEFRGSYVLIDFWATWSAPSLANLEHVHRVNALFGEHGLRVLGVSLDADYGKAVAFQATDPRRAKWPSIHDKTGELAKALGVEAIPRGLLVDPDGILLEPNISGPGMESYFELLFNPSGLRDTLEEWLAASPETRGEIEKKFEEAATGDADGANSVAWNYLRANDDRNPEACGLLRRTLESAARADGEDEAALAGRLDTAALAAYHAGDAQGAVELQDEVIALVHKLQAPLLPDQLVADPAYAGMIVRLGLYNASAGDMEKARACGQFVWPRYPEDSPLKRSEHFKKLIELTTAAPPAVAPAP
jgi:peroxiredoxin